ncbi:MAG: YqaE/Pmp3 family membrane protein [Anaerolineae bacterium]|nr:YqaE/Pmp3 family membrane protein [Anaerolineae bacterium]
MGCGRALLCIVFPPLAVLDRGCGTVIIVFALTLAGWIPGAIAALILNFMAANQSSHS